MNAYYCGEDPLPSYTDRIFSAFEICKGKHIPPVVSEKYNTQTQPKCRKPTYVTALDFHLKAVIKKMWATEADLMTLKKVNKITRAETIRSP